MALVTASLGGGPLRGFQNFGFVVELGLGKRAKRATCNVIYDTVAYPGSSKAKTGQVLRIEVDGAEVFEGPVHIVDDKWLNPTAYKVSLDATDWTPFLDSKLVTTKDLTDGSLPDDQTLTDRVSWILSQFCPGFNIGTVESNEVLAAQTIDYRPASVVFDELAELTNQVFDLDFDKFVNFWQTGSAAPIAAIDVDTDLSVSDVEVTEDWSDLHNVLLVKDFTLRSAWSYEERFTGDGHQSFFKLSLPPWSVSETVVSVSKDGGDSFTNRVIVTDSLGNQSEWEMYRGAATETEAEETIRLMALEEERKGAIDGNQGEAYVCLWNQGIRFPGVDIPANGDVVRVRYPFERPQQTLEVKDLTSKATIAAREGTDGEHHKVINIPELRAVSLESAVNYARTLLERGAWPIVTGSFHTYVTGWEPGQTFTIHSATRDIEDPRSPGDPVTVWVSDVTMIAQGVKEDDDTLIDHEVSFTSQPYAVPIPLDEMIWRLIDRTTWLRPPGTAPDTGTEYTTSTSTSTTTTVTSTSTTMTISSTSTSTTLWPGGDLPVRAQVMFGVPGTLSVNDDQPPWYICSIPHNLTLLDTNLAVKTAPMGAAIEVDIQRSPDCGSTWWSIYSTKPTIAPGTRGGCGGDGVLSTEYICEGDLLRLDVTQVGSTVAGADLTVSLVVRQGTGTATPTCPSGTSTSTTQTGTSTSTTSTLWQWESPVAIQDSCGDHPAGPDTYAIDGNTGSAWIHLLSEDHDIVLDLGESKTVRKIRLYVYPDQSQSQWCFFQAYLSDDLEDWGSPVISSGNLVRGDLGAGWEEQNFSTEKSGRYLWLTLIDTQDIVDHVMGAEIEVYVKVIIT